MFGSGARDPLSPTQLSRSTLFPVENGGTLDAAGKPLPLCPARLEGYEQVGMSAWSAAAQRGIRRREEPRRAAKPASSAPAWRAGGTRLGVLPAATG